MKKRYQATIIDINGEKDYIFMSAENEEEVRKEAMEEAEHYEVQVNEIIVEEYEPLNQVMGVQEAAIRWGYENPDSVKRLCATGKVKAKKIGKTWVIAKDQPNPKERVKM